MALTRQKKEEVLAILVASFKEAKSIWFAKTNTMTVEEFWILRKSLREIWGTYNLAKKTLIIKALKIALDIDVKMTDLPGQVWVVVSTTDAVAALGKTNEYIKSFKKDPKVEWVWLVFDGEFKGADEAKVIAGIPSRETLLSRLVGSMMSPLSGMARFFDAAAKELSEKNMPNLGSAPVAKVEAPVVEEVKEEVAPVVAEEVVAETTEVATEEAAA